MKNLCFKKYFFSIFLFLANFLFAQGASFLAPDTVCQNEVLELEYTGLGGERFCWISSPVFRGLPFGNEVFDFPTETGVLYFEMVKDNGKVITKLEHRDITFIR